MLLTVTIGTPKYLCVQDNCLVIKDRHEDKVLDKIPLCDIWVIIIDNPQVSITASLMGQVNDAGIGVLFCGSNHMPNGLALPIGAHSRHAEIVEHQLAISKPLRNQLWAKIVRRKIENQARALEFCGGKPCDVEKILSYARGVQSNDKTHREGAAASEYFSKLLPYGSRWTGPMTAPLNFGYAILRKASHNVPSRMDGSYRAAFITIAPKTPSTWSMTSSSRSEQPSTLWWSRRTSWPHYRG